MSRAKLFPVLLLCSLPGVLGSPSLAHAAPPMTDAAAADGHFQRGTELADKGQAPEAEVEFEKAWALRKAWDIAGNLGLMEAAQGKWEEAAEHLHYALTYIGGLATPEQRQGLQERYDNVRARVARVDFTSAVEAMVTVGTRKVFTREPFFISEGTHRFDVSAEGYEPQSLTLTVVKGETKGVPLTLRKREQPPGGGAGAPSWLGWVLGGSGLAAAGAGAALLGLGQAKLGDASSLGDELAAEDANCGATGNGSDARCDEGSKLVDDAGTFTVAGGVLVGVGVAALVGAVLVWTVGSGETAPSAAWMLVPWTDGQSGGLVMQGAF